MLGPTDLSSRVAIYAFTRNCVINFCIERRVYCYCTNGKCHGSFPL